MNYIISGLLAISQTIITPFSFRWIKEMSAQIFIIIILCALIWKQNKWVSLFILWNLFLFLLYKSLLITDATEPIGFSINVLSFLNFINIVLFGLLYYVLHRLELSKSLIYKTICGIAVFQSLYVVIQSCQLDQFFYNFSLHDQATNWAKICWPVGTWANESLVAWCIAVCSPFFLAFKKLRYKLGYGLCFAAILLTRTTGGLVAFVVGGLFYLWFKNKKWAIILTATVLLISSVLVFSGKYNYFLSDTHRYKVWAKSIEIWKKAPITGLGLGSYRQSFFQLAPEFKNDGHWAQAHNEYVQIPYEQGLVGLGIILMLMGTTFFNFWKQRKGLIPITSLLIFSIVSIVGFPARTAMGVLLILSLVLAERDLCQTQDNEQIQ